MSEAFALQLQVATCVSLSSGFPRRWWDSRLPETSAALVSTGVYSFTRNPMYLGMLLGLFAWTVFLSSIWSLTGPLLFAVYVTRFQIIPEERALDRLFGASFAAYTKRVRRWL